MKQVRAQVCCSDDLERPCHIPWAGIGENVAHPVLPGMETPGVGRDECVVSFSLGTGLPFGDYDYTVVLCSLRLKNMLMMRTGIKIYCFEGSCAQRNLD